MSNKTETFWSLLEKNKITIPKIQRDYAYGRSDAKSQEVRLNLLESIKTKIEENICEIPLTLDFVYGNLSSEKGIIPIDGQQRLTTLFLLHYYAAKKIVENDVLDVLLKFSYETRHSASQFCKLLIKEFEIDFESENSISKQILNQAKYLNTFNDDPTIQSMLVVLDEIHEMFYEIENLCEILTKENRIVFYYINLEDYSLTDDLYIKMNSRGKSLTKYEIFKSNFEEFLEEKYLKHKERISRKLDVEWTNMLWNEGCDVDSSFLSLLKNIFIIIEYEEKKSVEIFETEKWFKEVISSEEKVLYVETFFDVFSKLSKNKHDNISKYFNEFLYTSDEDAGIAGKIRVFYNSKENLFLSASKGQLGWSELIFFYCIFLCLKNNKDSESMFQTYRIIRNLLVNSSFELRPQNIHLMLNAVKRFVEDGKLPSDTFNKNQLIEEEFKFTNDIDHNLLEFENHNILRGSVGLFINTFPENYTSVLVNFNKLFINYKEETSFLRKLILSFGDYSQLDTDERKRLFVHREDAWNSFFTINNRRKEQDKIVKIVSNIHFETCESLENLLTENFSNIDLQDWRYYFIKYDEKIHYRETQGYFYWKDFLNKPLEIIMLNSSVESISNLEWNVFNWILFDLNREFCTLDNHGASKLIIYKKRIALNAIQDAFEISVLGDNQESINNLKESILLTTDNKFIIPNGEDYIKIGQNIIDKIIQN